MTEPNRPLRCQACPLAPRDRTPCTFENRRSEAGQALLGEGAPPPSVFLVRRGRVVLSTRRNDGHDATYAVRGKDTLIGVEGVFERPLAYSVHALTDVLYCEKPVSDFAGWIGPLDSPAATALRLSLEETVRRTGERLAVDGPALRRVARFLVSLEGASEDESLPMALSVLASVLRMRPETLSRALGQLREAGALEPRRGVCVRDFAVLGAVADGTYSQ